MLHKPQESRQKVIWNQHEENKREDLIKMQ
jgi:hypothetical protein